ncbi:Proteasome subunit alpha type [Dorcoceras hygrometricum]|uniref:Proteasome subunit alpha type n=1 Tax=Dorcoceras hygrometricum TaxID=472368 RepID=A0A2Z6ZZV4_9LAMI|nr:Proteasome subunit alpha type [Dorcoceras hygrometricum]
MVDRMQKKAKGFAAQIGVLLKNFPAIPMGDGVPFPSAKVLSMRTVHTYIVTNTTIDARTESEEPVMAKTPKGKKKHSFADEMPVDMFAELTASKKRSATAADAPIMRLNRKVRLLMPHCLRKILLDGWMTLLQDTMSQKWLAQIMGHKLGAVLTLWLTRR